MSALLITGSEVLLHWLNSANHVRLSLYQQLLNVENLDLFLQVNVSGYTRPDFPFSQTGRALGSDGSVIA